MSPSFKWTSNGKAGGEEGGTGILTEASTRPRAPTRAVTYKAGEEVEATGLLSAEPALVEETVSEIVEGIWVGAEESARARLAVLSRLRRAVAMTSGGRFAAGVLTAVLAIVTGRRTSGTATAGPGDMMVMALTKYGRRKQNGGGERTRRPASAILRRAGGEVGTDGRVARL